MNKIKWIWGLLANQVENANAQLEGEELVGVLNLLILDYQNLLKEDILSEDVRAVQESVIKEFNALSE